jgi:hypothetical protein
MADLGLPENRLQDLGTASLSGQCQDLTGSCQDTTGYQGGKQPQHACPACGYCPCCGRGGGYVPNYPLPYVPPYIPSYPYYVPPYTITCAAPHLR